MLYFNNWKYFKNLKKTLYFIPLIRRETIIGLPIKINVGKIFSPIYFRKGQQQDLNSEHEILEFYNLTKEIELVLYE